MHNFLVRLASCFIINKKKRKDFRARHRKVSELEICMDLIKKQNARIDALAVQNMNLFWVGEAVHSGVAMENVKKDFFLRIPKADGDLRVLQTLLKYMLKSFKDICEKNGIKYWLQAGTLVGATRHAGFVPWDDDVDVGMMRCDLEKLREVLKDHQEFEIRDYYHTDKLKGRMSKFVLKNTKLNCFIDLPVYEYVDARDLDDAWKIISKQRKDFEKDVLKLRAKLSKRYDFENIENEKDLALTQDLYDSWVEKMHKSDGGFIYWAIDSVEPRWRRVFNREMFFPQKELSFEGDKYTVPMDNEKYLSQQYGDIYSLPKKVAPEHAYGMGLFDNIKDMKDFLKNKGIAYE